MFFLEEACSNQNVLAVIYFVWTILSWVLKIVPIILIVMVSLDFAKNLLANGVDAMNKNFKVAIFRILSCILCFSVPAFVATMNTILGDFGVNYSKCLTAIANGVHVDNNSSGIDISDNDNNKPNVDIGGNSSLVPSSGGSDSDNGGSGNSDYLYFLSLKRGNAMLLQSTDSNGKKIFGMYDIGSDKNCSGLIDELKAVIGNEPLEFLIASHFHGDHVGCFPNLAKKVKIKNVYVKNSATSSFMSTAKKYGVTTYKIKSSSSSTKNNSFYLVDANNNKVNNSKLTIVNNINDWNKSYGKLSFGNFNFTLLNLPERKAGNYDSLVLYGTVHNHKFYLTGDLQNSADDSSGIDVNHNLANYYASYLPNFMGNSKLDFYHPGHHTTPQGTSSYIVNKIIGQKTIVASTFTFDGFIGQYKYMSKGDSSCFQKFSAGSSSRFRCLNDEVVNRIIKGVYNSPNSNSTFTMYYQNMLSKKSSKTNVEEILKFKFNRSGEITSDGGYKIMYNYKKSEKKL